MNITSVTEKALNACHRLNAEAYENQVLANGRKPLKQFIPCPKAIELMSVIREGIHLGTANEKAIRTTCSCHSEMTLRDLINYECDPSYKEANYNHDLKTLYPRLHKT
jgi:hypothetical protein